MSNFSPYIPFHFSEYQNHPGYISQANTLALLEAGLLERLDQIHKKAIAIHHENAIPVVVGPESRKEELLGQHPGHRFDASDTDEVRVFREVQQSFFWPSNNLGIIELSLSSLARATDAKRTSFGLHGDNNIALTIPDKYLKKTVMVEGENGKEPKEITVLSALVQGRNYDRRYIQETFDEFLKVYDGLIPEARGVFEQIGQVLAVKHEAILENLEVSKSAKGVNITVPRPRNASKSEWDAHTLDVMTALRAQYNIGDGTGIHDGVKKIEPSKPNQGKLFVTTDHWTADSLLALNAQQKAVS